MNIFKGLFTKRVFWIIGGLMVWLAVWASPVYAHKVSLFAWVEGDTIHTESKFSGGKMVKDGRIEVFNSQGELLLTGTTDDQGAYSFPIPERDDLKVVLTAGSGHGNYWIVPATEMDTLPAQGRDRSEKPPAASRKAPPEHPPTSGPGVDMQDIEAMVAKILEAKLAPLRAQLADPAWGLRDVLGGVGYILGLMGLAAYLHYRRQTR